MTRRAFTAEVDRLLEYVPSASGRWRRPAIAHATVPVTEGWARRVLGLGKDDVLVYRGVALTCIGSRAWRARQADRDIVAPASEGGSHANERTNPNPALC